MRCCASAVRSTTAHSSESSLTTWPPTRPRGRHPEQIGNAPGKAAAIQQLARCLVDDPSHRGVARMLYRLGDLKTSDDAFADVEMDHYREFHDAIRLGDFENPDLG